MGDTTVHCGRNHQIDAHTRDIAIWRYRTFHYIIVMNLLSCVLRIFVSLPHRCWVARNVHFNRRKCKFYCTMKLRCTRRGEHMRHHHHYFYFLFFLPCAQCTNNIHGGNMVDNSLFLQKILFSLVLLLLLLQFLRVDSTFYLVIHTSIQ